MTSSKRHSQDIAQVVNPPSSSKKRTFWGGRRAGTPLAQGTNPLAQIFEIKKFQIQNFDLCFFCFFVFFLEICVFY